MRSGQLCANLEELNEEFHVPRVDELIQLKRTTKEKITLSNAELDGFSGEFERLVGELGRTEKASSLKEAPDNRAAFDTLLRDLRSRA